jgi:hypothetical protein
MAATISSALQAPRISRVTASSHVYTVPVVRELPTPSERRGRNAAHLVKSCSSREVDPPVLVG